MDTPILCPSCGEDLAECGVTREVSRYDRLYRDEDGWVLGRGDEDHYDDLTCGACGAEVGEPAQTIITSAIFAKYGE